jgi:alpha-1,3/alpha-1,6-mannosyltransferase
MANANTHVVFIHLDLGIGGAESLVLNLAKATLHPNHDGDGSRRRQQQQRKNQSDEKSNNSSARVDDDNDDNHDDGDDDGDGGESSSSPSFGCVSIYTTHCSPTHCYDEVRPPDGPLSSYVRVRGSWIPRDLHFGGTALCSACRMLYLAWKARRENPDADVFVIDVLPTGVPYLVEYCNVKAGVLFYCHFPDKLLTRDTVNGEVASDDGKGGKTSRLINCLTRLRQMYRWVIDGIEEWSMSYCDLIVVNSNFTRGEVRRVFPSLFHSSDFDSAANSDRNGERVKVLYPSIETSLAKQRKISSGMTSNEVEVNNNASFRESFLGPIVSLNRFERKKNVELLLRAYDLLIERAADEGGTAMNDLPPLIIAGGYDPINAENVEHLAELRAIGDDIMARYDLPRSTVCPPSKSGAAFDDILGGVTSGPSIAFLPSISNARRTQLLSTASVWCYTPHREHFGIVPLEAMGAGVPVVAIRSGGPMETIVDGMTGYLVDYFPDDAVTAATPRENPTVTGFANAIHKLLSDRLQSKVMGQRGRERVDEAFGMETFRRQWWELLHEAQKRGMMRHSKGCTSYPSLGWSVLRALGDMFWVILIALICSWSLKKIKG